MVQKLLSGEVRGVSGALKLRAEKTSLFLTKLTSLSHLRERKQRNCLNCNAEVHGKYCHICGQENLEPTESVWHLVSHFINDITHFDGKFFSTLGLLIARPGFLSAEYKRGKRNSYLNPVKMYVFTSFVFFFVFFSTVHIDEKLFGDPEKTSLLEAVAKIDSSDFANFTMGMQRMDSAAFKDVTRALNFGSAVKRNDFQPMIDSLRAKKSKSFVSSPLRVIRSIDSIHYKNLAGIVSEMDSNTLAIFTKAINQGEPLSQRDFLRYRDSMHENSTSVLGKRYKNRAQYDSLVKIGAVTHGWLKRAVVQKLFDVTEKISKSNGKVMSGIFNIVLHNFPQMLFFSLPLFALFLKLIYWRRKEFYIVSHGIYTVHLYIFYFIVLLAMILLNKLGGYTSWNWPNDLNVMLTILLFVYEYKAMRNFYGQRRAKTFIKFLLAGMGRFFIIIFLFLFFLLFSFLKI